MNQITQLQMEPGQTSVSAKESVDFHVSYLVVNISSSECQFYQKPLKHLYQCVCEAIAEESEEEGAEEVKSQEDVEEVKSDSPTFPPYLRRRPYPIGNRIFKSSLSGRLSPDIRLEGTALSTSTKYATHAGGPTTATIRSGIQRVPSSRTTKTSSYEATDSATSMLSLKDLKRLDFHLSNRNRAPSILIRRHCIVVAIGVIRAILLTDRVILLCPSSIATADSVSTPTYVSEFASYVQDWTSGGAVSDGSRQTPFEFHVLEGLMVLVKASEQQEYIYLNTELRATFQHYCSDRGKPKVDTEVRFKNLKNALFELKSRLVAYRACLNDLMENEEQMALMNLTYLKEHSLLYKYPLQVEILQRHEHTEDMLETDLLDFSNMQHNVSHLESRVANVEAMYHLKLNIIQNMALRSDTFIMLLICSIAFASYIAGSFGMNLDNNADSLNGGFSLVFVMSFVIMALVFYSLLLSVIWSNVFPHLSPWKF